MKPRQERGAAWACSVSRDPPGPECGSAVSLFPVSSPGLGRGLVFWTGEHLAPWGPLAHPAGEAIACGLGWAASSHSPARGTLLTCPVQTPSLWPGPQPIRTQPGPARTRGQKSSNEREP